MGKLETRCYPIELRTNDTVRGKIQGRPIIYNSITDIGGMFAETIERGALDDTNLKDVLLFVNHDAAKIPLARSRNNNGNSTMQLTVDDRGLLIEAALDIENNSDARALYSAISRGDIDGMSFAFQIEKEEWEEKNKEYPTRHIKKIGVVREVSAVNYPAYTDTSIYTRSMDIARETLDSVRKSLDSDNTASKLLLEKTKTDLIYKFGGIR